MTMTQISDGASVLPEPGAKPPVGPLFGPDEAENLSLLFDPPGAPVCVTEDRTRLGGLTRLLPALSAIWF